MGHATLWPVPRAIDAEAHHYPRHWKRNFFFLYSGAFLMFLQLNRYGLICRVSQPILIFHLYLYLSIAIIHEERRIYGLGQLRCTKESQIQRVSR